MTITAASSFPVSGTEHATTRESRYDEDRAPEFAGMFAGAMHAQQVKAPSPKAHEGTSELDRPSEDDETTDDGSASETRKADDANAAAKPDSSGVVRAVGALDPALQEKLARVMARVRNETGHDVTITETFRTQTRQDALFAQGRETSGPVVTWTQASKHTQGRAVDVMLDGGAAGPDAYAALQRIAQEEGLRTLGARDPGHLELPGVNGNPRAVATTNDATPTLPVEPADATGPGQVSIARIAQLAQVAKIAEVKVERPATVARVATAGQPGATGNHANAHGTPAVSGDAKNASQKFSGDSSAKDGSGTKEQRANGYSALATAVASRDTSTSSTASVGATTDVASNAADRVAKMIAAYEDAPARPLSSITMNVDAGNGTTDRVQVALRGASLNATIDASDPRAAHAMSTRSDELVRALNRDGITVDSLHVRAVASVTGPASSGSSQGSSEQRQSQQQSRSDRGNLWQQQDRQRSQQDERRQQQRDQRGGNTK